MRLLVSLASDAWRIRTIEDINERKRVRNQNEANRTISATMDNEVHYHFKHLFSYLSPSIFLSRAEHVIQRYHDRLTNERDETDEIEAGIFLYF